MLQAPTPVDDDQPPSGDGTRATVQLRDVLDDLPALVSVWDVDARNVFANRACLEWFALSEDEMYGKALHEVLGPAVFAMNLPYLRGVLAGQPQAFERVLVNSAGEELPSQITYTPHLVDGAVTSFVVLVCDISARLQQEALLLDSTEREALARERDSIALKLNDTVSRVLFGITLDLSRALHAPQKLSQELLAAAIDGLDDAIEELRASIFRLRQSRT